MFTGKIDDAVKNYGLLEILYYIKHDEGIDYRLDLDLRNAKERVGVCFKLHNKEHYMILDDIIFDDNDELDGWGKRDMIMGELLYYFDLENNILKEFKKAIEKEFSIYEADDNERVEVKFSVFTNGVEVALVNDLLDKRREIGEYHVDGDINYNNITYANARDLGYEVAHKMLEEYWGRKYK